VATLASDQSQIVDYGDGRNVPPDTGGVRLVPSVAPSPQRAILGLRDREGGSYNPLLHRHVRALITETIGYFLRLMSLNARAIWDL